MGCRYIDIPTIENLSEAYAVSSLSVSNFNFAKD